MAKQPEKKVIKESPIIADRPITMAPENDIKLGMKYFLEKEWQHMHKMQDIIFGRECSIM
jgi:hypothetical protein